ncbi:glycosyltransferase family 2 protein [Natronoflexus pectinivorans]|uniref:Glycosyl transferase family 2 n=1 Tax=Natronoflexus pectinivorans TaxID=682526 RepID=A0A4R2GFB6_9BACT|nr:glycosyltransferase family 2 protein [Natronoflexus pectinivorans]TCO06898.1 glycosyl transferase family 2 [Natronoflexus pectinivorans]
MLISIITPNYNSAQYIEETWNSIQNQTHQNWEWLVIDDGSNDNSPEIIQKLSVDDSRIKLFKRTNQPKGASACRNIGIENTKGEYALFLDADDLLAPYCLENRIKQMGKYPGLDFGVFNMRIFQNNVGDSDQNINKYCENDQDYLPMFLSYQLPWQTTCPLWRSSFLNNNQIWLSENYQRLQDPEFHSKILLCHNPKFKVFKESEPDCFYRQPNNRIKRTNSNSLTKTTDSVLLYYKEIYLLLKQHKPEYIQYLDNFTINIFHSLLFYTKLPGVRPVAELYREMNNIRIVNNISMTEIRLFAYFNIMELTFIKGAGVSRLWKILHS